MTWPWVSRRRHEEIVAELERDALLALVMAFADAAPQGTNWSVRARAFWAEVRG